MLAQVDCIKNNLNFTDPDGMFQFATHGIKLSGINSNYICKFQHEINAIAKYFRNNWVSFDTTHICLICGKTCHDFNGCLKSKLYTFSIPFTYI